MRSVGTDPKILACERTGYPTWIEDTTTECPECGRENEVLYRGKYSRETVGCDCCVKAMDSDALIKVYGCKKFICPCCNTRHDISEYLVTLYFDCYGNAIGCEDCVEECEPDD